MVVLLVIASVYNVLGDYALRVPVLKKKLLDSLKYLQSQLLGLQKFLIGKTKRRLHDRKTEHFKALAKNDYNIARIFA